MDAIHTNATLNYSRGDSRTYLITLTDVDDDPVDLTGATLWFTVKRKYTDADEDAIFMKRSDDATQIEIQIPASGGLAKLFILPADTRGIPIREYDYDLQVKMATGEIITVGGIGIFNLRPDVTIEDEIETP